MCRVVVEVMEMMRSVDFHLCGANKEARKARPAPYLHTLVYRKERAGGYIYVLIAGLNWRRGYFSMAKRRYSGWLEGLAVVVSVTV